MADIHDNSSSDESSLNSSYLSDSGESSESSDAGNNNEAAPYQFEPLARAIVNLQDENVPENNRQQVEVEPRIGNSDWCTCDLCSHMPTERESHCCQEVDRLEEKIEALNDDGGDIACITQHPGFASVCLDRYVLETAYFQYRQQYGEAQHEDHERNRYVAYRQLVRWCWGFLGKEIRVVLPSCAVARIRQEFPSQQYRGFNSPS